ncbi:MAG TPA: dTMP kinase [Burkholderiaceae bacterium]|nr:dTMP kinase [Burkholderiaceae bacterium]
MTSPPSGTRAPGRFITFEGIDGSGKSTQVERVAASLRERGIEPLVTREPGGTEFGEALRALLLQRSMTPLAELLLMFAARSQHVEERIRPALAAGRIVLCDRFTDASFAYQSGGRGLPAAWVEALESWTQGDMQPDGTLLFDLPPEEAAQRVKAARRAASDRFDREQVAFFARVRAAYLHRAREFPRRVVVIDASHSPQHVARQVEEAIERWTR